MDRTRPPAPGQDPPARRLRLVHPAPPPKPDARPRTRGGTRAPYQNDTFTEAEQDRLRAALRGAKVAFGTWPCLADAMRVPLPAIMDAVSGRNRVTASIAIRLARALGKSVDSLYRAPMDARTCPTCGATRTP